MRCGFVLICFFFLAGTVSSQQTVSEQFALHFEGEDVINFTDSISLIQARNKLLLDLWNSGYVYAGIDSVKGKTTFVHKGELAKYWDLEYQLYDNFADSSIIESYHNQGFDALSVRLNNYTNSGYPFARTSIKHIRFDQSWKAVIDLDPGPFIVFDSLVILGKAEVGNTYLQNVLNLPSGKPFSEKAFRNIDKRIQRLPYLTLTRTPDVSFQSGKSKIFLTLKESKQSSFEGVLGFLPNQSTNEELTITGYLDLQLSNLFQSGKGFDFSWSRFANLSQSVDLHYYHPYLFSSPLFVDAEFSLLKQDSSFTNQKWNFEMGTFLWNTSELFFGINIDNGNLINPDELDLDEGFADYKTNSYSLGLRSGYYHKTFELGKSLKYYVAASAGEKEIRKNPLIPTSYYDTLDLNTLRLNLLAKLKYQIPIKNRLFFFQDLSYHELINNALLSNELVRIGGLKSLRGFNENFFYSRSYLISRIELRQYFESRSFIMLFYDTGFIETISEKVNPHGIGVGMTLNTSNGLFTFASAIGGSKSVPFSSENIKIHIGYISTF